jgi:hypothetical protein
MGSSPLLPLVALASLVPAVALAAEAAPIQDNSFLIEEAYNQEPGVIHHISSFTRSSGGSWCYSFTEEWPVLGQTHQASITFNYEQTGPGARGLGDMALNYRWQALGNGESPVAVSPRLTLLLPTGDAARGLGVGGGGFQVNLPISVVLGQRLVTHFNVGGTFASSVAASSGGRGDLTSVAIGQSVVWLARSRLNFLVEPLYTDTEIAARAGVERTQTLTVNPGVRAAFDLPGGLQIVPGVGLPIGFGPSRGNDAVFLYLSFEHPFRGAGSSVEG